MARGALCLAFGLHALLLALPLALASPERLAHPLVWVWLGAALALHAAERWATGAREDAPHEGLDRGLAGATGALLLASQWTAALEFGAAGAPALGWTALGALLLVAGIALRVASIRTLGHDFVSGPLGRPGGRLRNEGVYAWSRHPSELGLLAFAAGGALLLGSALALGIVLGVLAPLVAWRLRREDRALSERFADYPAYAARVGWLGRAA